MSIRNCFNWIMEVKAVCPWCLSVEYYCEITSNRIYRCKNCKKTFKLGLGEADLSDETWMSIKKGE